MVQSDSYSSGASTGNYYADNQGGTYYGNYNGSTSSSGSSWGSSAPIKRGSAVVVMADRRN